LRSLGADSLLPTHVIGYPSRTIYSKTLRSGTTYAQYRDTEEEEKDKKKPKPTPELLVQYVHLYPEERDEIKKTMSEDEKRRATMFCVLPPGNLPHDISLPPRGCATLCGSLLAGTGRLG